MKADCSPKLAMAAAVAVALAQAGGVSANDIVVDGSVCTLSAAIASANGDMIVGGCTQGSGADTITIAAATTTLTSDLPAVTTDIAFEGQALLVDPPSVTGDSNRRLFVVGSDATVSFTRLTLAGGVAKGGNATEGGGGGAGLGGAIFIVAGSVSVSNVAFTSNSASGGASSGRSANNGSIGGGRRWWRHVGAGARVRPCNGGPGAVAALAPAAVAVVSMIPAAETAAPEADFAGQFRHRRSSPTPGGDGGFGSWRRRRRRTGATSISARRRRRLGGGGGGGAGQCSASGSCGPDAGAGVLADSAAAAAQAGPCPPQERTAVPAASAAAAAQAVPVSRVSEVTAALAEARDSMKLAAVAAAGSAAPFSSAVVALIYKTLFSIKIL
jgi:hypothetical protein